VQRARFVALREPKKFSPRPRATGMTCTFRAASEKYLYASNPSQLIIIARAAKIGMTSSGISLTI